MAAIGTTANSYEILSKLAEGGMAELFLARAIDGEHHVVLKRIARERATDTQFVQMFLDEARLAAQLRHPNIAQVFDIGRLGVSYFFTMEYVHGVTVEDIIERVLDQNTAIPVHAVLSILAGTAAGLKHAHERTGLDGKPLDIVHRDISPSNLMVSYDGHVKIVDFGVAKAVMSGRPETQAGEIKGKVGYLSPEQCRLQKLDRRSDLYSLGVVAWEMLTGKRLWKRETAFGTMAAIATEDVPLASEYREDLPREVDALVAKLLATEVGDRFQSAGKVIEAIDLIAASTRSNTSPAQVARLLRELFGNPVEPWLAPEPPRSVSVTAGPIPAELDTHDEDPEGDTVEHKLTSVFSAVIPDVEDVSTTNLMAIAGDRVSTASVDRAISQGEDTREIPALARAPSMPGAVRLPRVEEQPTARARVAAEPGSRASTEVLPPEAPTYRLPTTDPAQLAAVDPALGRTILGPGEPLTPRRPTPPSSPPPIRFPLAAGPMTPLPSLRPSLDPTAPLGTQLPHARGSMQPGPRIRGSGVQEFEAPSNAPLPRWPPPPHGDVGKLRYWLIGGALLSIVLLVIVLVSRSDSRRVVTAPPTDATVIVAITPDAAEPIADATEPVADAAEAPADANVAAVDADIAPDAAPEDDMDELDKPMPKPVPRTKLRTKGELNAAFRMRRYKDIVTACSALGPEGDRAVVCTLAACRARDGKAQDWYRHVPPNKRDGAIRICKQAGHVIKDICATDLMACRQ